MGRRSVPCPLSHDDDSNFAGRERIGRIRGKTPRSNKAQKKQFDAATRGLSKDAKESVHLISSKKGYGYRDLVEIAEEFSSTIKKDFSVVLFGRKDEIR